MINQNSFKHCMGHCFLIVSFLVISACGPGMTEQQMLDNAKNYLDKGDLKAASLELRSTLQANNENAEARYLLGNISFMTGDLASAEKQYRRAALGGWDQEQTQIALARIFIATKKFNTLLDEVINQSTWSADTRANVSALRALAEAGLNKRQLAKITLEEARNYKADALQVFKTTAIFQLAGIQEGSTALTLKQALSLYPDNTELMLLLATYEMQNKNLSAAADTYNKIINSTPPGLITTNSLKAQIGLARLQIIEKKLDEALATLKPLLKSNKNNPEANYLAGFINFSQGNYNRAEDHMRNLLAIWPKHSPSQQLMGKIKYALKDFKQASLYLSEYLKTAPDSAPVRKLLTQTYIERNQPKQALLTLQPILTQEPDNAIALSLLSQIALMNSDPYASIAALTKAIASNPDNIALHKQLIKTYITTGETQQALDQLKTLQALSNHTEENQMLTIFTYLRAGKAKQAIYVASKMLAADPKNPEIIALKGTLHAANNEPTQARKYFNKALQLQGNLPSATVGLAHLEKKEGNLDKAIALYTKLTESGQAGIAPMLALSELAELQKRTNDMLSWLEKARTAAPRDITPRIILTNYYLHNAQPIKADIYIREALKISPEHPKLLALFSRVLIAQKHYSEALPPLKTLVKKQPDSITSQLLLSEVFLRLGKTAKARKQLLAVLKIQPSNPFATILIAETEFIVGDYDRSLAYAKKLQQIQPELFTGYMQEGDIWMARKNYKQARQAYTKAWKRQQTSDLAKRLLIATKHITTLEEATKPLFSWLKQHPEDIATRMFLASVYQSEKQNDKAVREYEVILKWNPDHSTALNNLAWFYSINNNPQALNLAERAYRLAPDDAGIQDTYGWILTQQGQAEKGLRLIRQAMQTLPDNPDIRFHFAGALIKSGDSAQGKRILKKLLDENTPFESRKQAQRLFNNAS